METMIILCITLLYLTNGLQNLNISIYNYFKLKVILYFMGKVKFSKTSLNEFFFFFNYLKGN